MLSDLGMALSHHYKHFCVRRIWDYLRLYCNASLIFAAARVAGQILDSRVTLSGDEMS